jgi:protein-disulfide isomerase
MARAQERRILWTMPTSNAHPAPAPRKKPVQAPRKRVDHHAAPRLSRRSLYLLAVGVAGTVAAILIAVSVVGGKSGGTSSSTVVGAHETEALLAGIEQHGTVLGSPEAPVRLVEYADLQCPYCGVWARDVFPTIVREYVRTGKVQLEFRGLAFVGDDSVTALRTALGTASQGRLWHTVDLLFRNQGTENKGWVSESLLNGILAGVPGLDARRALSERDSAAVTAQTQKSSGQARAAGIDSTPTFQIGLTGGELHRVAVESLDVATFEAVIEDHLAG